jgi:hypothetical protein
MSAITAGVALVLLLAVILLYMGIIDVSELLPFLEMASGDCDGGNGVDDNYVMQYDDADGADDY